MPTPGPGALTTPLTPVREPEKLSMPGPKKETARIAVPVNDKPQAPSPDVEKPMTPGCAFAVP
jgi:hypothetical protein